MIPHVMMEGLKPLPNLETRLQTGEKIWMGIKFGKFTTIWLTFNLAILSEVFLP